MTLNNSILLILKQNKFIEYNDLLSKFVSRYKNNSSANAALSRAVKDLTSLGQIKKEHSTIYITDKGLASVRVDMKEKLVLNLNEKIQMPLANVSEIVQLLIILYERAHNNPDLLNSAKASADFTIHDIRKVKQKLINRREFLLKMIELLDVQEERLKELDFNEVKKLKYDSNLINKIISFVNLSDSEKIIFMSHDRESFSKIPKVWRKESIAIVDKEFLPDLLKSLLDVPLLNMTIYLGSIKIVILNSIAYCYGQYNTLKDFSYDKK
ncbi:MAG: hypothetical protein PHQ98_01230 [Candidatus ainarchaeum sp.]|nr:hypothetical protein [Candidatus ainarchaeum sp.]